MIATRPTLDPTQIAKSSAAAVGISLLCFLPPLVHFISGPLGPFIGGFIVGMRRKVTAQEGLLIGIGMGVLFGIIGLLGVVAAELLSPGTIQMYSPLPIPVVWLIPLIPMIYAGFLGSCGAVLSGYLARQSEASEARKQ
jgi:hypothetical protein